MSEAEPASEVPEGANGSRARDPLLGRIVGVYRIREKVGEGTGLPAYLAEHVHLDRTVLFKLFHPPRDGGETEAVRRAIQQARELSALKHEGVLPLVEIAECGDGFMYVVLELSGGRPLPALLAEGGPLRWPAARTVGRQVAAALLAADAVSLATSEPAASQIFVSRSSAGEWRAQVDLVTPEALGWVPARSPDQAHAVGQLLYTMLAGHEPPSASESPPDLMLSFPDHDIPADADALVMRAVDAERSRRWPDLGTLYRELGGRDEASRENGEGAGQAPASAERGWAGAEHDDAQDDATFGRRFFARPSRRALIAAGVGVVVAVVVALAIVSGPSEPDAVTFKSAANSTIKLTPPPAPTPMVVPPPPVPDPEPESPEGPDAAARAGAPAAVASPQNALGEEKPRGESSGLGEAAPAVAATGVAATGVAAPAVAAPAAAAPMAAAPMAAAPIAAPGPEPAAIAPAAATPARGVRPAMPGPGAAGPASSPPSGGPQKAAAAPAAVAALSPARTTPTPPPVAAGAGSAVAPAPSIGAVAAAAPVAPSTKTATPGTAPPGAAPAKEGAGQPCTLSLGSIPWSDVQVDGQRAGFTPLTDLPIACGTHEILFTSPERALERRIIVNLRPGEKLKRIVELGGPKTPAGTLGAAAAARPACRVTLGSRPWSEVWIDGHRAGTTPLVDYPIACGTHDVLFLSREANVQHRESLNVQSTLKKVITLVEATE